MKKFRGKKRYFRNLWRETTVENYDLDFGEEGWFDLWHTHLDFVGLGNNSLKIRREHIKAHITLYENLIEKLELFDQPYQSWVVLSDNDAEQDAVYIHTKNPNDENFPLIINKLNWNTAIPHFLEDLIDINQYSVGMYTENGHIFYAIQSKNAVGLYRLT